MAILVATRYPLDRQRYNEIRQQLAERRRILENE
jgi:Na+/melibiose symporter-like transporter